jgi:hypothetical protein
LWGIFTRRLYSFALNLFVEAGAIHLKMLAAKGWDGNVFGRNWVKSDCERLFEYFVSEGMIGE